MVVLEKDKLLVIFNERINQWKNYWCVACRHNSIEGMVIHSCLIEELIKLKCDLGLIDIERYTNDLREFRNFKRAFSSGDFMS